MARRSVLLLVALLIGLLGTTAVYAYVQEVDDRAIADVEPVEVLVAKDAIPAGTSGAAATEQGLLQLLTVPKKAVPEGALGDIEPVRAQVALSDIFPGEMLLSGKFGEQQTTGALSIPADKLALSVELGDPQRVAGFVQPGSEVAVFVTLDEEGTGQVTRMLLPRVGVVAVGPTSLKTQATEPKEDDEAAVEEDPVATAVLTVAVSQAEAERLVHAVSTGQLYFGLLSPKSATAASEGVTSVSLFG